MVDELHLTPHPDQGIRRDVVRRDLSALDLLAEKSGDF
jgi:hypothetical protein